MKTPGGLPAVPPKKFRSTHFSNLFLLVWLTAWGPSLPAQPENSGSPPVQIEMRNVHLHLGEGIVLDVRYLRGQMISRKSNEPPVFGDPKSYTLEVFSGEASISTGSLTHLLNDFLFAYDGAPLKDLKLRAEGNRLKMSGKLKKALSVPFSVESEPAVSPDGKLLLHNTGIKAAGVPAKGLMDLFDLELDELVSLEKTRGVVAKDNDLLLDPGRMLPPPVMKGRLASVKLQGDRLVQTFASEGHPRALHPARRRGNYIFFEGNTIRLGKLTMSDTDLQLVDADPSDPFDFYPEKFLSQLVAGYSKNTLDGGLITFMPDFEELGQKRKPPAARGQPSRGE